MTRPASMAERVTGAVFWNSVLIPVKTVLNFAFSFTVVRILSQTDYAILTVVLVLLTTIGTWSDLGIESTIARFFPEAEYRFGRRGVTNLAALLLAFKFALLAVILAGLFLFKDAVSAYFGFAQNAQAFLVIAAFLLYLGILSDFILQFLSSNFHQKATNVLDILFGAAQLIFLLLFVYLGWAVVGVLLARLLGTVAYVVLGVIFVWRAWRILPRAPALKGNWGNIARRFTRLSSLAYATSLLQFFSDLPFAVFVLTFYHDVIGVALFGLAFSRVVSPIRQFLMAPTTGIGVPMFARLHAQNDLAKMQSAYTSLFRFMILLLVPSGVGLALLQPNLIRLLYQSRYELATGVAAVLILGLFGEALFTPAAQILVALEQIRVAFVERLITLLAIPLLFIAVPTLGALGAAVAISVVRLAARLYITAKVRQKFNLTFPLRFFTKVLFASALMALAMLLPLGLDRPHDPIEAAVRTTLAFVVGSATFLISFKRLGSIEAVDRERLALMRIPFKHIILNWL